jgi:hypothetical protein
MHNKAYPELEKALGEMLDKIDTFIKNSGYKGEPVKMYLAGGMAINYWCGTRYTADVDASFSKRLLLNSEDLVIDYQKPDGEMGFIYFDRNYNNSLSLMHENYEDDAIPWMNIENQGKLVHLYVLSPLDLALSKVTRFTEQDREDINALAQHGFITEVEFRKRAEEAASYAIGVPEVIQNTINIVCNDIANIEHLNEQTQHINASKIKKDKGIIR